MQIITQRNKENILEFNKRHIFKAILIISIMSCIIYIFGILELVAEKDSGDIVYGVILVVFGILFTPLFTVFLVHSLKKSIARNPLLNVAMKMTYNFEDENIQIITENPMDVSSDEKIGWDLITKCVESKNLIMIYVGKNMGYIIDKRFVPVEDVAALKELLIGRLGQNRCKFKKNK